jgi:hypothetical protein
MALKTTELGFIKALIPELDTSGNIITHIPVDDDGLDMEPEEVWLSAIMEILHWGTETSILEFPDNTGHYVDYTTVIWARHLETNRIYKLDPLSVEFMPENEKENE